MTVMPQGFSKNPKDLQNVCLIVNKVFSSMESLQVLNDDSIAELLFAMFNYWLLTPDTFGNFYLTQSVIELTDLLVYSKTIWQKFKSSH